MAHELSKSSLNKYMLLHKDAQLIIDWALKLIRVDFGISQTFRTYQKQLEYYLDGKSRLDPRRPDHSEKAKHMKRPAEAWDFFAWVSGFREMSYDNCHLTYLGSGFVLIGEFLYKEGLITHKVRWGGNWDMDGHIIYDQKLRDLCHCELINA